MKVFFVSPYPTEGPSYRYRVEQYFEYLGKNGIKYACRPFMTSGFYRIIYKPKNILVKTAYFLLASVVRVVDFLRALWYDIIFIHLEAYPIGPPVLEFLWSKLGKSIVYDLDDAIYLTSKEPAYKIIKFIKFTHKVQTIIRLSKEVIVCNSHLKNYADSFKDENKIHIIPTSLDTDKFIPCEDAKKELIVGWIGSYSTVRYLDELKNVFKRLCDKYNFTLKIVGSSPLFKINGVKIINKEWSLSDDLVDFQSLDIGVYPLPDNEWTKGKTGFKTMQYMAVGIPCVVSNVGSNKEIIRDGVNGFLADSEDEWVKKLSLLIEDKGLRKNMGFSGRKTVVEKYSLKVNAPILLGIIQRVYAENNKNGHNKGKL